MLKYFIKISRPRFWFYLAGPFLVGAAALESLEVFLDPWFYILFIYFLIPANIYLYGINDYFDFDTDKYNIKKEDKESRLEDKDIRKKLKVFINLFLIISIVLIILLPQNLAKLLLVLFLFLATFYSAPPLRFKRYPLIDSLSNVLYIFPGLIIFALYSHNLALWSVIIASWSWAAAMHLFSAILDIMPDKKAGLKTTAVLFGEKKSMWICFFLWLIFSLVIVLNGWLLPLSYLFFIYPLIPIYILIKKIKAEKVYWYFPYITGILGFFSFWYLIIF